MLGCVAFTMCFYTHPFLECSKLAISKAKYIFPHKHKFSEKMCDLIRLMLTPNPKARPNINKIIKIMKNWKRV
jgi:AP2-associated kinase